MTVSDLTQATLIQIAQTPEISREVIATSKRNSIRYIYELEIKPRLISTHLGKDTPPRPSPQNRRRLRKFLRQNPKRHCTKMQMTEARE